MGAFLGGWLAPWKKRVGRAQFAIVGVLLMAVKYAIDTTIAKIHGADWTPWSYWDPGLSVMSLTVGYPDRNYVESLLLVAIPFIFVGLALTCARVHDAGMSPWSVALFFVPWINLFFFAVLSTVPSRDAPRITKIDRRIHAWLDLLLPRHPLAASVVAVVLSTPTLTGLVSLAISSEQPYGPGLFVGAPFVLGALAAFVFGYREPRNRAGALFAASLSLLAVALSILLVAAEGILCLIMAAPLAVALTLAGGLLGWAAAVRHHDVMSGTPSVLSMVVLLVAQLSAGGTGVAVEPVREVLTSVEIDAPAGAVWRHVVSFPPLPPPTDLVFRAGIASPQSATIMGAGVGAVRYCEFTTGAFVEPITVWDPPRVLRFDVTSSPSPLTEWNPIGRVDARHLKGTFQAIEGEFRLVPIEGGRTRLEGRTWYRNAMAPRWYWGLWSDSIVHRIHARVLRHIESLSESDAL